MPSYIEFDKQSSFPTPNNQGKTIFGIDTTGQAILKDNSGSINLTTGVSSISNLLLNTATIGTKVSFTKTNYGSEVDVIIPGFLEITRGNGNGIFNIAQEPSYGGESPKFTKWNSRFTDSTNYGWSNVGDSTDSSRNFSTWYDSVDGAAGNNILHNDFIMFFNGSKIEGYTGTNKYYLIKFTQWTAGNNGGGFSYDRYELYLNTVFERPNYSASTVDVITAGKTVLKRDNNGGGLYNEILESFYDQNAYQSPLGTEWNSIYTDDILYGWNNLNNIRIRTYGTFREALNGKVGNYFNTALVMHDLSTDLYYKILIKEWQGNGEGGGVIYTRTLIPENQLIVFPDKTVQRTAGLPTYIISDANTFYVPEPCILFINNDNPVGTIYLPNPSNFNGQKIEIVYKTNGTKSISELSISTNLPINPSQVNETISSLNPGTVYEFTSVNGYWYITKNR